MQSSGDAKLNSSLDVVYRCLGITLFVERVFQLSSDGAEAAAGGEGADEAGHG